MIIIFYDVYNVDVGNIEWSGKIYVRPNETVEESLKRHFPKYEKSNFTCTKSKFVYCSQVLIEDLKEFLKEE